MSYSTGFEEVLSENLYVGKLQSREKTCDASLAWNVLTTP
jgi:hypothetical protein